MQTFLYRGSLLTLLLLGLSSSLSAETLWQDSQPAANGEQTADTNKAVDSADSSETTEEEEWKPSDLDKDQIELLKKDKEKREAAAEGKITNDAVIFGMLMLILGFVFYTSKMEFWLVKIFYKIVPMLLLCYFLPSLLTFFGIINPEVSSLYYVATRFLLPASLVLLTLSIDLQGIINLGPKALIMFLTGTLGVVLGGPLAIFLVGMYSPELVGGEGPEAVWRGLSTVAGSWIGGGANQVAMKEIWGPSEDLYGVMVAVDVIVAEVWMAFLLLGVGQAKFIDWLFKADASSIDRLQKKMENFSLEKSRNATTTDLMVILAIAFAVTAVCHLIGDFLGPYIGANFEFLGKFSLDNSFFWLIVLATAFGVAMSFTDLRNYEGAGASKIGTVFIFILVATIGMKMDITALSKHPGLFLVGGIWMLFHVILLFLVGWLIRAPYFFLAVGSKANIGGAASAPVVAAAFHPSLAPVGVLLAVLGYALGTYGAWLCAIMMRAIAPVN